MKSSGGSRASFRVALLILLVTGALASTADAQQAPIITSIVPDSGPTFGGTEAVINGSYFESDVAVTIGGTAATVNNVVNPGGAMGQIEIVTPPGTPGAADVVVTNPGFTPDVLTDGFTYMGPAISGIVPNSGPTFGGTPATINGGYFHADATVTIDGAAATVVSVVNPGGALSQINIVTPVGTAGPAHVVVTNPDSQNALLSNGFTYILVPPVINNIVPNNGPASGGMSATINGSYFAASVTVTIGGAAATVNNVVNPGGALSQIQIDTPAGPPGAADVIVTNPDSGTDTLEDGFTYFPDSLYIYSIVPDSGPAFGGTEAVINGAYFETGLSVTIGGTPAIVNNVVNPGALMSQIEIVTPLGTPGAADVVVTNPDTENFSLPGGFTYVLIPPTISSIAPASGPTFAVTSATINGSYFAADVTVTVGAAAATVNNVVNPGGALSQIEIEIPPGSAGAADVTVTNPDSGTDTLDDGFTYMGPSINSIVPDSGPTFGGTSVVINGSYFHTDVTVSFGANPVTVESVVNPGGALSQINILTPVGMAGPAHVVVTNPDSESDMLPNGFTYEAVPPVVHSIAPTSGPASGGTSATINGSYFADGLTVRIGGALADVLDIENPGGAISQIYILTPPGTPGAADVIVENVDSLSDTLEGGFTYIADSLYIYSIVPDSGPTFGGTSAVINGAYFETGVTVTIGGAAATVDNVLNPGGLMSQIEIVTPAGSPGAADVTVTNPDSETNTLTGGFTYVVVTPTITSVVPDTGPTFGGTEAVINGSFFHTDATVTIGGANAIVVNVVNPGGALSQIEMVTPPGTAGAANVTVTNPDSESGTLPGGFTYVVVTPAISGVVPDTGPTFGGTSAVINGSYFAADVTVTIGGAAATVNNVVNPGGALSQIEIVTPPGTVGAANVTVTNPDSGTDTLVGGFTYVVATPVISSIVPNSGGASGGTSAAINGSFFAADVTVTIGGAAATVNNVVNPGGALSQIEIVTPPGTPGAADVTVTNPDSGTATLVDGFTYIPDSVYIYSIVPDSGPASGGTDATINGAFFETGATVTIGGAAATVNNIVNPGGVMSQIQIVTPPGTIGPADVVVTNPDTQSAALPSGFTYLGNPPSIVSIVPDNGPMGGGTDVTINGSHFDAGVALTIGGAAATVNNVVNPGGAISQIEAVTPAGTPGPADVVVINPDSQSDTLPSGFTYTVPPGQWTFMVYLDADNNIEHDAVLDFLEMGSVGSTADVKIVVQMDRISGYDSDYGNWTSTKRFHVTPGMTPTAANALEDIGEANMGNPQTLIDFINWAAANFPSERYALVLWDHGDGWRASGPAQDESPLFKAICWDDTNGGDALYTQEIRQVLETIEGTVGTIELIGLDACLNGMIEVAYEIREHGQVMVASEEVVPSNGWPYDTLLGDLTVYPAMSAADLGTVIVDRYYESYPFDHYTCSAIDLAEVDELGSRVDTFAQALIDHWQDDQSAVLDAAESVTTQIDQAVIHERHGASGWPGSHGLAIYFPVFSGQFNPSYNSSVILFALDTQWDEFLQTFYISMQNSWVAQARGVTQYFQAWYYEHIDLYDFCLKLGDHADSDGDGLSDADENNIYGTDPNDPDTDEDGLNDGDEVTSYQTDPTDPDTDDDGLPDGWEVFNGLDPNDGSGDDAADGDPDGDTFTNEDEYYGGSDPLDPASTPGDLVWSTFIGGMSVDELCDMALETDGTVYVTGETYSSDFPTGAGPTLAGDSDMFVVKLSSDGTSVVYWSCIGGNDDDEGECIAVDSTGAVNLGGRTASEDFPTTTGDTYGGGSIDGFIVQLNSSGSIAYSTYIGGSGSDRVLDIALDAFEESVYVVGTTDSTDLPVSNNAWFGTLAGGRDVFVGKFGDEPYLTYFGGSDDEGVDWVAIAVNARGDAFVAGATYSDDFPTAGAPTLDDSFGGPADAFVTRLNSDGSNAVFSTYLGGSLSDGAKDIALDDWGDAYIVGATESDDFPVTGGVVQPALAGVADAFVAKLAADGTSMLYSTYLGGEGWDVMWDLTHGSIALAVDGSGMAYVVGYTESADFPKTQDAFNLLLGGPYDAFLSVLSSRGSTLAYSTYLGGDDADYGTAVAVDSDGYAFVAGGTYSNDFPITGGAFDESFNGGWDGFVTKFDLSLLADPDRPGAGKSKGFFDKLNPCFIATAAYGTPAADEVGTLLKFRDGCLLTNRAGRAFVRTYYRLSPPMARFIAGHPAAGRVVRGALVPVVGVARLAVASPVAFWIACAVAIAFLLTAHPLLRFRLANRGR